MTREQILDWLDELKNEIPHGASTVTALCETGDRVVTVAWSDIGGCVKPEGKPYRLYPTENQAWWAWQEAFAAYRDGTSGKIYWRQEPQLTSCECGMSHYISARLFIAEE